MKNKILFLIFSFILLFFSNTQVFAFYADTVGAYLEIVDTKTKRITKINNDKILVKVNQRLYEGEVVGIFGDSLFLKTENITETINLKKITYIKKLSKKSKPYHKDFIIKVIEFSCVERGRVTHIFYVKGD